VKAHVEERAKQPLPAEIVGDLLASIRGAFYGDFTDKQWHQEKRFLTRVVTWPAAWFNRRAVTVRPERYKQIVLGILDGIKAHGSTAAVKFWPGYLLRCVQEHFKHHGDEYYEEGKAVRSIVDRALSQATGRPAADPVQALAQANAVLAPRTRARKIVPGKQLDLI
jgi:hypothetical protein